MKKIFIMMACVATMLVGCSKDDDTNKDNNASDTPTVQLKDNQASLDGKVYDVESSVGWQINFTQTFMSAFYHSGCRFILYESFRQTFPSLFLCFPIPESPAPPAPVSLRPAVF